MKILSKLKVAFAIIACTTLTISCDTKDEPAVDNTITGVASRTANLSILVQALNRAGLADDLQNSSAQLTVFAPTNDAFNKFFQSISPSTNVDNVDLPILTRVLLNHVVASEIKTFNITTGGYISTLSPFGTGTNPPTISMLIQKTGIVVNLNGGSGTTAAPRKGATVSVADLDATNGVIQIVDAVIQIPTILDHALNNTNFSTLVTVVTSTSAPFGDQSAVAAALSSATATAPLTVFAPLNTAFAEATGTTGFLTGAAVTAANVTRVLRYHVVAGNIRSSAITTTLQSLPTLATNPVLNVRVQLNPTAKITDTQNVVADIVAVDVQGSNGVVHAVSKVLRPF